jgi:hypothetical protein
MLGGQASPFRKFGLGHSAFRKDLKQRLSWRENEIWFVSVL